MTDDPNNDAPDFGPPVAPTQHRPRHMRTYQAQLGQSLEGAIVCGKVIAREHEECCVIFCGASCVITDDMSHQLAVSLLKASCKTHQAYHRINAEGRG